MKSSTAVTTTTHPDPPSSRATPLPVSAIAATPQCDVLFEMFSGELGSVHLGRLLKGHDAGRLVTLRKLSEAPSSDLASSANLARIIAHPRLVKVLGLVRQNDATYLASEYIPGATLFELGRAVTARQAPVATAVAVRIMLDALRATQAAQSLLAEAIGLRSLRCLYPESTWIADFGETFVSEVLVAPVLAQARTESVVTAGPAPAIRADVCAAACELMRLACGGLDAEDPLATDVSSLPEELQRVLACAVGHEHVQGYSSLEELIVALEGLGDELIADEGQVAAELRQVMATTLDVRRQKLEMLERSSVQSHWDDNQVAGEETKFFRAVAKTEQRDTTRPPPKLGLVSPAEPPDDVTLIFRRPSVEDTSTAPTRDSEPSRREPRLRFRWPAPRRVIRLGLALAVAGAATWLVVHTESENLGSIRQTVSGLWR